MKNEKKLLPINSIDDKITFYQKEINELINKYGDIDNQQNWDENKQNEWLGTCDDHYYDELKENIEQLNKTKIWMIATNSKTTDELNKKLRGKTKKEIDNLIKEWNTKS